MKLTLILLCLVFLYTSFMRYKTAFTMREKSMYVFLALSVFLIMLLLIFVKPK